MIEQRIGKSYINLSDGTGKYWLRIKTKNPFFLEKECGKAKVLRGETFTNYRAQVIIAGVKFYPKANKITIDGSYV